MKTVLPLGEDPPAITSVCFNHNGKILAASAVDGMIHMFGILVHRVSMCSPCCFALCLLVLSLKDKDLIGVTRSDNFMNSNQEDTMINILTASNALSCDYVHESWLHSSSSFIKVQHI